MNTEVNTEESVLDNIPTDSIYIGQRFRQDYGDMDDFVESIKDKGVFTPITVRPYTHPDYDYELMAGGRRVAGAIKAELTLIPALVRDVGEEDLDLREVELFENCFRKDMEWYERIALVQKVQELWTEKFKETPWKWSARKCAKMLGVTHTQVNRQLNLAKAIELIPDLKNAKDETEARKKIKQIQEKVVVKRAIEEQAKKRDAGGLKLVELGDCNYNVGDAFEGMESLVANKLADEPYGIWRLIEVDPPYAIDLINAKTRKDNDDPDMLEYNEVERKDYNKFLKRVTNLCYDLAADDAWLIFWFGPSWFTDVKIAIASAGWMLDPIPGIWNKGHGQTMSPDVYLARSYEPFFIARKGKALVQNKGRSNVFTYSPVPPGAKYHPTQRPLPLMEDILSTWGFPNSSVLCPFLGSGTTLRAAYRNHMSGFGWDLSQEYKKRFLVELEEDES